MASQESLRYFNNNDPHDIVIVDDLPDNIRLLTDILKLSGFNIRAASSGKRAIAMIKKKPPSLILLDIMMPEISGYEVCKKLKADEKTQNIPIIFLSALNDINDKIKAFSAGGVDYISKPFEVKEVLLRVNTHLMIREQQMILKLQNEELIKRNELIKKQALKLKQLATTDHLTGLSNRRDFLQKAHREEIRFKRFKHTFGLCILDIDFFKKVNDTYGHDCGDKVLIAVAKCIKDTIREQDLIARWGGEEFVCIFPEINSTGLMNSVERIRNAIENMQVEYKKTQIKITITLGTIIYNGRISLDKCIEYADKALYKGKNQGRNQVVNAPV